MERHDIENMEVFAMSLDIGEDIWDIVITWTNFAKNAIGYQIVKVADSIAANISEGYGRYSFKEKKQFCNIS